MLCDCLQLVTVCVCCRRLRLISRRTFWITSAVRCQAVRWKWSDGGIAAAMIQLRERTVVIPHPVTELQ